MIIDKKCFKHRGIKDCTRCLRYDSCITGVPLEIKNYDGALELGMSIVGDVCLQFEKAYRRGHKANLDSLDKWLRTPQASILTAENYDGVALADALWLKCKKQYGDFRVIYDANQKRIANEIKKTKKELAQARTNDERRSLNCLLNRLEGEKNL